MSLIEAARAARKVHGPRCSVSLLDPDTAAEVAEALADPTIRTSAVAAVLKDRGVDLSANVLQRHRRGDCQCR